MLSLNISINLFICNDFSLNNDTGKKRDKKKRDKIENIKATTLWHKIF